ncbi:MAG TPA: hypothetical protein VFV42_04650 [Acidimicrobiales bacterium]|nr:hypothetical protein [Acidimicrobiales bacterium]
MSVAPEPAERPRRTVPAGAFVVAVMVAAALAILAVVALASDDGGGEGGSGGDEEVRLAAGRFTERFLTYEGDDFESWKADIVALATGGFAEEFEEAERGLRVFFEEGARDAVAEVSDVFVGQEDRGALDVVVVYDREVSGGGEEGYNESDRYLQLSLLRVDGEWLVDDVIDVATAADLGAGAVAPASTTSSSTSSTTAAPGG